MSNTALMKIYDVKLGLAIHVKAPNGKYIVIDLGSDGNKHPIKYRTNDDVAFMVLTHPHYDHFSDIDNITYGKPKTLRRVHALSREKVMEHASSSNKDSFKKYCDFVEKYNQDTSDDNPNNINTPSNYGGLDIKTYSTCTLDQNDFNNFSIVTVFMLAGIKIVVCGDNTIDSLNKLMKRDDFKLSIADADVLVAPHHGRQSCYNQDFMDKVNPRLTIISDGKYTDASAADDYGQNSRGWKIWNRQNEQVERNCLTTRNDGDIQIEFGPSSNQGKNLLYIKLV